MTRYQRAVRRREISGDYMHWACDWDCGCWDWKDTFPNDPGTAWLDKPLCSTPSPPGWTRSPGGTWRRKDASGAVPVAVTPARKRRLSYPPPQDWHRRRCAKCLVWKPLRELLLDTDICQDNTLADIFVCTPDRSMLKGADTLTDL